MALNTYIQLGGPGEASGVGHQASSIPTATVQLGEHNISQVASRLGFNKEDLLVANPQIKDPSNLNVGQEIHLPTRPTPKDQSNAATPTGTVHTQELPNVPVGSSLEASVMKGKLDALAHKEK